MSTPQYLLERYVEAKDLVRPHLMQEIYAAGAVLTFSIATDSITFPRRVSGIDGITKTLVVDFGAKYSRCKTFYVCDSLPQKADKITMPWLVLMSEPALACLRIGKGYYEWTFGPRGNQGVQVVAMHIHIETVDAIADAEGKEVRPARACGFVNNPLTGCAASPFSCIAAQRGRGDTASAAGRPLRGGRWWALCYF